jgi:hypothetical protein
MLYLMEAVHSYARLGEIIQVMKEVFGVYEEPTTIKQARKTRGLIGGLKKSLKA